MIDSTGAAQCGITWLKDAGVPIPDENRLTYQVGLRYQAVIFHVDDELEAMLPMPGGFNTTAFVYTFALDPRLCNTSVASSRTDSRTGACCFIGMQVNPGFAQGCTKAAGNVLLLDKMLRNCNGSLTEGFSQECFKASSKRVAGIWETNKTLDYGFPNTAPVAGETREKGELKRKLIKLMGAASEKDAAISTAIWRTRQMLSPEDVLTTPSMLVRAVWALVRRQCDGVMGGAPIAPLYTAENVSENGEID